MTIVTSICKKYPIYIKFYILSCKMKCPFRKICYKIIIYVQFSLSPIVLVYKSGIKSGGGPYEEEYVLRL